MLKAPGTRFESSGADNYEPALFARRVGEHDIMPSAGRLRCPTGDSVLTSGPPLLAQGGPRLPFGAQPLLSIRSTISLPGQTQLAEGVSSGKEKCISVTSGC